MSNTHASNAHPSHACVYTHTLTLCHHWAGQRLSLFLPLLSNSNTPQCTHMNTGLSYLNTSSPKSPGLQSSAVLETLPIPWNVNRYSKLTWHECPMNGKEVESEMTHGLCSHLSWQVMNLSLLHFKTLYMVTNIWTRWLSCLTLSWICQRCIKHACTHTCTSTDTQRDTHHSSPLLLLLLNLFHSKVILRTSLSDGVVYTIANRSARPIDHLWQEPIDGSHTHNTTVLVYGSTVYK